MCVCIIILKIYLIYLNYLSYFSLKILQQNVFLVTKISKEIFFVAKNTALATKYEFRP